MFKQMKQFTRLKNSRPSSKVPLTIYILLSIFSWFVETEMKLLSVKQRFWIYRLASNEYTANAPHPRRRSVVPFYFVEIYFNKNINAKETRKFFPSGVSKRERVLLVSPRSRQFQLKCARNLYVQRLSWRTKPYKIFRLFNGERRNGCYLKLQLGRASTLQSPKVRPSWNTVKIVSNRELSSFRDGILRGTIVPRCCIITAQYLHELL